MYASIKDYITKVVSSMLLSTSYTRAQEQTFALFREETMYQDFVPICDGNQSTGNWGSYS